MEDLTVLENVLEDARTALAEAKIGRLSSTKDGMIRTPSQIMPNKFLQVAQVYGTRLERVRISDCFASAITTWVPRLCEYSDELKRRLARASDEIAQVRRENERLRERIARLERAG